MFKSNTLESLLKDGSKHFSGVEQTVLRNSEAVRQFSNIPRTSMGPNGLRKMIVNHLDKLFVTHDTATIIKELEVIHPAAKMVSIAAQAQEKEVGDGTNLVLSLSGELMLQAENLLKTGLHTTDIIEGYKIAEKTTQEILPTLCVDQVTDLKSVDEVSKALNAAIASKLYGYEDFLSKLVAQACVNVCPAKPENFNVDNVRVAKINGGSVSDSYIVKGFAIVRDAAGSIKHVKNAKVAIYSCSIDVASTETKGTVLIKNAEDLKNYNVSEEKAMEREIKEMAEAGVNVVVTQGSFGEMALHFIERYNMMAVKCPSKFQLRRLSSAVGGTTLVRLGAPTAEEMGHCDFVDVQEIGDQKVIVFKQADEDASSISTIVVRGATNNLLDEVERAIDDGVNVFKTLTKDRRLVCGAGGVELALYHKLSSIADETPGLEQYAIRKYAESFLVVPRTLIENSGLDATEVLPKLIAEHKEGKHTVGVNVESSEDFSIDTVNNHILDCYSTKYWAIKLATAAILNVLSVDQIIMARPAGGPKPPKKQGSWDED